MLAGLDLFFFTFLALVSSVLGRVQYLGVAISGIDFGCDIDGSCPLDTVEFPLLSLGGGDGEGQMKHFVEDDKMNMMRLPVSWQYILNNQVNGTLDPTNFGNYDQLVQICLDTGAYCIIDMHNFARYDGGIIGQGGPSNQVFASLWTQIATKYAKQDRVVFGLMNEPHDLDINAWAQTCQAVVTAIRSAGATSQMIFLPGTDFESAATLVSSGSFAALANVSNPDGSKDNLLLDIHKYLDIDNSGTHTECVADNVAEFQIVVEWLRNNSRVAIVSETGASMDPTCLDLFCVQNQFISNNTDVLIGVVAWAAGSFATNYTMSLTPYGSAGNYTDNELMKQCILGQFGVPSVTVTAEAASTSTDPIFREETASAAAPGATQTSTSGSRSSSSSKSSGGTRSTTEPFAGGLLLLLFGAVAAFQFHGWRLFVSC